MNSLENQYIVEMRHITKRFPGIVACDDVTLGIKRGEVFALLGENGAGKSTLMSMLFGMYEPSEGQIFVRGNAVKMKSSRDAADLNIGMVHQHFVLVSNYTIAENIILGLERKKKIAGVLPLLDIKGAEKHIAELSKSYGLEVDPSLRIDQVNVSMQQRVEILKMLYRDAEILIFDEPTAVLTPQEIEFLLKIIDELRNKGKTIILITHKLEEIKKIADRCAVLRRGKLVSVFNTAEYSTQEMANLMVGREVSMDISKNPPKTGNIVLEVENLSVKNEKNLDVVKDVSFKIREGEIFAIAGVSGNGQVELADAIAGLARTAKGRICLCGKEIDALTIRQRVEAGIAYIPEDRQKYGIIPDFTLQSNLVLKSIYKSPFCEDGIIQTGLINEFAVRLIRDYDIRSAQGESTIMRLLSGGNQQKAILAREISLESKLIIFVQPTRGMDIGAIENIRKNIIALRDSGKAVLLVSLELDEVMALADTIGVIYNGSLQKVSPATELDAMQVGKYMMGVK
ncbi:MAG: ABC transporter ATP-binding protein [Termitinemataceae bacterium]|nr:MAG: ABC transporter ATP-binding protein [Termitinemataceae bacterium]